MHQSLSFTSTYYHELLDSQHIHNELANVHKQLELETKKPNPIHYWRTLMIGAPEKFNELSKLFFIKKKLVIKSNELTRWKTIFHEKKTLYQYLNKIYTRRQVLGYRLLEQKQVRSKEIRQRNGRNFSENSRTF